MVPKPECVIRCLKSVVNSAKYLLGEEVRITVIDDHSDTSSLDRIKKIVPNVISIEDTGYSASISYSYKFAKEECNNLIYFVEDDYLHELEAIREMVTSYYLFKMQSGNKEIVMFPLDGNDRYKPNWLEPCIIVPGASRYWRTILHTTANFMISKQLFLEGWEHFDRFSLYNKDMDVCEANTIENVWKSPNVLVFSPIPTLTYHLQIDEHLPLFTYLSWKKLWNNLGE
jgi:hypothetical protein